MGNVNRIGIIGSAGQLGSDVYSKFASDANYHAFPISHANMDITDHHNVDTVLRQISPDVVINCAAYVRVDDCEDDPWLAFRVNTLGPMNISNVCSQIGAKCIHISTDFVFDGTKGTAYNELDIPNPVNTYGISKLIGEKICGAYLTDSLIIRVSSLFGLNISRGKGSNFIETIINKSKAGEDLRVISDVYMSPTYTLDVSQTLHDLVNIGSPSGIYHMSNSGSCSWFELAKEVLAKVNPDASLTPIKASEYSAKATRPPISSLVSINLSPHGIRPMRNWKMAVSDYLITRGHIQT